MNFHFYKPAVLCLFFVASASLFASNSSYFALCEAAFTQSPTRQGMILPGSQRQVLPRERAQYCVNAATFNAAFAAGFAAISEDTDAVSTVITFKNVPAFLPTVSPAVTFKNASTSTFRFADTGLVTLISDTAGAPKEDLSSHNGYSSADNGKNQSKDSDTKDLAPRQVLDAVTNTDAAEPGEAQKSPQATEPSQASPDKESTIQGHAGADAVPALMEPTPVTEKDTDNEPGKDLPTADIPSQSHEATSDSKPDELSALKDSEGAQGSAATNALGSENALAAFELFQIPHLGALPLPGIAFANQLDMPSLPALFDNSKTATTVPTSITPIEVPAVTASPAALPATATPTATPAPAAPTAPAIPPPMFAKVTPKSATPPQSSGEAGRPALPRAQEAPATFWAARSIPALPLTPSEIAARVQAMIADMSDEEILSQTLLPSFPGTSPDKATLDWIAKYGLGGIKIFGWNGKNPDQVAQSIRLLQSRAQSSRFKIPLFIATDQEGGWVAHIKGRMSITPGNMAIGATGKTGDAWKSANIIGKELSTLGINMNLAPVVDIASEQAAILIGTRAFSDKPEVVATLAEAFCQGLTDAGVIPVPKHFPGHGGATTDSHSRLPYIEISNRIFAARELEPFRVLIHDGIPAILSGHLAFPQVSGDSVPASMSPYFMKKLLREELHSNAVAITDDINMAPVQNAFFNHAFEKALEAGNDMVLSSSFLSFSAKEWNNLLAAYRADLALRQSIRKSVERILALKLASLWVRGYEGTIPDPALVRRNIPDPEAKKYFADLAARSATLLNGKSVFIAPDSKVLVISPLPTLFTIVNNDRGPRQRTTQFDTPLNDTIDSALLGAAQKEIAKCDVVILCITQKEDLEYARIAKTLNKKIAIIVAGSPWLLRGYSDANAAAIIYSFGSASLEAGYAIVTGARKALGVLPVRLEG